MLFALSAAREALADSGAQRLRPDPGRDRLRLGRRRASAPSSGRPRCSRERGPDRVSPTFLPEHARRHRLGPARDLARHQGRQLRDRLGLRDRLARDRRGGRARSSGATPTRSSPGGTEACIDPLILAGFTAMHGLAAEDEHPPRASRPFDATRAGFVMAEGAGAVVVEDWDRAERARGRDLRRGARLRRLQRRAPPRPARARGRGRRGDDAHRARARRRRARAGRLHQRPRHRDAARRPRRDARRSRASSATTPTGSPSPRRSR